MIAGTGRHFRRRSSIMISAQPRGSLLSRPSLEVSREESLVEEDEGGDGGSLATGASFRRRAVDASDLRSCAMVQSKLKNWKNFPFPP